MISDKARSELVRSHTITAYVDVISASGETKRFLAIDGSIRIDSSAAVRRSLSVTCVDVDGTYTPRGSYDLLTPYGTELRPYRGVRYADGTEELAPLGVFRISKVSISDSSSGAPELSIEAFDRSRTIARDKFIEPYPIASGTNVVAAAQTLVERSFINPTYDVATSALMLTAPMVFDVGDDPWASIMELSTSAGFESYFDSNGTFVCAPSPGAHSGTVIPDFKYIEGPDCTMTDLSTEYTDEPGYNGVVVSGESTGDEVEPVRVVVWDENPQSPTYHLGPYNEVPKIYTDRNVKTVADATAVANQLLQESLGFSSQLSITAVVNPWLEPGDIVEVRRDRTYVNGMYIVDSFTIPLRGATHDIILRKYFGS